MEENLKKILDNIPLEEVDKLIPETMEFQCDEVTKARISSMVSKKIKMTKDSKKFIKRKNSWKKYSALTAGLAFIIVGSFAYKNYTLHKSINTNLSKNSSYKDDHVESGDVIRNGIIYNGNLYYQSGFVKNTKENYLKLVGEFIGNPDKTSSKPRDKYDIEHDTHPTKITNRIYKVKGYDETFRICMIESYRGVDAISFFEYLDYGTLKESGGSGLYRDRLSLMGNIVGAKYKPQGDLKGGSSDVVNSTENYKHLKVEDVEEFINSLNNSTFVGLYPEGKSEKLNHSNQGHLYLEMNDGTTVELRLIEGGYVRYEGTNGQIFTKLPLNYLDGDDARIFQELFAKIIR